MRNLGFEATQVTLSGYRLVGRLFLLKFQSVRGRRKVGRCHSWRPISPFATAKATNILGMIEILTPGYGNAIGSCIKFDRSRACGTVVSLRPTPPQCDNQTDGRVPPSSPCPFSSCARNDFGRRPQRSWRACLRSTLTLPECGLSQSKPRVQRVGRGCVLFKLTHPQKVDRLRSRVDHITLLG